MKNVTALFHENSYVDKKLGVTFKGYSLTELKEFLPRGVDKNGLDTKEPLPESLFHLFLTGDIPNKLEISSL